MKLKYYLGLLGVLLISIFVNLNPVWAYTLTTEESGYYYVRERPDGSNRYPGTLKKFTIDGSTAFCIEPGVAPGTSGYTKEQWDSSSLKPDIQKKIFLYAYYGYSYPEHQTKNYRAATQALIWEAVLNDGSEVKFYNGNNGTGGEIDVSTERNTILSLAQNYDKIASFAGNNNFAALGNTGVVEDYNKVIEDFTWTSSGHATLDVHDNTLYITPTITENFTIYFTKKHVYDSNFKIFHSDTKQDIIVAGEGYPVSFTTEVEAKGGQVFIEKVDADTSTNSPQGESSLAGAVYGLYNLSNVLIETMVTDEYGRAHSSNNLFLNSYYIQEISPSKGYELDLTKYSVDVYNSQSYTIQVKEQVIKQKIEFLKLFNSKVTGLMKPEVGIKFEIYNQQNHLISTYTTNNDGKFVVELPYGKYILKQLTAIKGYEKINDYYFEVLESGNKTKVFTDNLIEARLKVIKLDFLTHKSIKLANIKFRIYDVANGEYVKQKLSFLDKEATDIFTTDGNGILITPLPLAFGTYILEEVDEKIPGFLWNKEKITFTIDENSDLEDGGDLGNIIVIKFYNKPVLGQINILKKGLLLEYNNGKINNKEITLEGVKYGLYASNDIYDYLGNLVYAKGTLIGEYVTDENGHIEISNLYLGSYYLQELTTLDNFIIDDTKYYFTLSYQDQYTDIITKDFNLVNKSKRGILNFVKIAKDTLEVLPNVLIAIYDEEGNLVYEGLTNEEGKIVLELPFGSYYLIEKEAPLGYVLDNEQHFFTIDEENKNITYTLENTIIPKVMKVSVPDTYMDFNKPLILLGVLIGIVFYEKKHKVFF